MPRASSLLPLSNFFLSLPLVLLLIFSTTMNTTLRMSPRLPSVTDPIASVDTSLDLRINSFCSPENHNHVRDSPGALTMRYYCLLKGETDGGDDDDRDARGDGPSAKQEGVVSVEEFNRITSENKKLTEMLYTMYGDLRSQMMLTKSSGIAPTPRKRKYEDYEWDNVIKICESSANSDEELYLRTLESTRTKVSRVYVRVDPSDMSLLVKDGYHWRKYGQKVTRDNPSPRAYFKCSFAPSCPVKKKVQRSVDDPSLLVATYEGQHNHHSPTEPKILSPSSSTAQGHPKPVLVVPKSPGTNSWGCSNPSEVIGPLQSPGLPNSVAKRPVQETNSEALFSSDSFPQFLVQQMASSLTKDPNFRAALATAISGRIFELEPPENC